MTRYSSFDHLVASIWPGQWAGLCFSMGVVEPYTGYMDDSGTETRARVIVAALCISPVKKWKKFEAAWIAAEQEFGFKEFHMTEFAGCRNNFWCRECKAGKKDAVSHPWREWSKTKRRAVLKELVRIICKYTEQGWGNAFTKAELDKYVKDPQLQELAPDQFGKEHYTFAATTVSAELARMRARKSEFPPLNFVFDGEHKGELAKAFLPEYQVKPQIVDGIEQWFDCGIAFESRKKARQLLAADMLAWITAKIRSTELYPTAAIRHGGFSKEARIVMYNFIDSGKLHIGYSHQGSLSTWLQREIEYWKNNPVG